MYEDLQVDLWNRIQWKTIMQTVFNLWYPKKNVHNIIYSTLSLISDKYQCVTIKNKNKYH